MRLGKIWGGMQSSAVMVDRNGVQTMVRPREQSISAVVTRADGTVEDLGVVAYWHRNPLIRLYRRLVGCKKEATA